MGFFFLLLFVTLAYIYKFVLMPFDSAILLLLSATAFGYMRWFFFSFAVAFQLVEYK
jgi:hypothetical protein